MPWLRVDMNTIDLRNAEIAVVSGKHVDNLQGLLKGTRNAAWDPGPIDGLGGRRTRAAVVAFQGANSLVQDAIVGPLTWGRLISFADAPVVALAPDPRPKAPAVDATAEFAAVPPQRSLQMLAARVIREIERRHPDEPGADVPVSTEWAVSSTNSTGTIHVRRDNFADDSLGGYEYRITAERAAEGWVIASATRSSICQRGVSPEGLCL